MYTILLGRQFVSGVNNESEYKEMGFTYLRYASSKHDNFPWPIAIIIRSNTNFFRTRVITFPHNVEALCDITKMQHSVVAITQ
jgi:hypothetical protein